MLRQAEVLLRQRLHLMLDPEGQRDCHLAGDLVEGGACAARRCELHTVHPAAAVLDRAVGDRHRLDVRGLERAGAGAWVVPQAGQAPVDEPAAAVRQIDLGQGAEAWRHHALAKCEGGAGRHQHEQHQTRPNRAPPQRICQPPRHAACPAVSRSSRFPLGGSFRDPRASSYLCRCRNRSIWEINDIIEPSMQHEIAQTAIYAFYNPPIRPAPAAGASSLTPPRASRQARAVLSSAHTPWQKSTGCSAAAARFHQSLLCSGFVAGKLGHGDSLGAEEEERGSSKHDAPAAARVVRLRRSR